MDDDLRCGLEMGKSERPHVPYVHTFRLLEISNQRQQSNRDFSLRELQRREYGLPRLTTEIEPYWKRA